MTTHIVKLIRCWPGKSFICRSLLLCWMLLAAAVAASDATAQVSDDLPEQHRHHSHHGHGSDDVVSFGRKADLPADQHADSVVAIFGSATTAGEVEDSVVSIMGGTRVTGPVHDSAVAVMGSVYVNSEVGGDVVAVLGNVELGPEAKVHGDVVVVGGELTRDPAATVEGHVQTALGTDWSNFDWLQPWIQRCLLYGRPLAFAPGLGWAWGLALGMLAFYLFIAFLFRDGVERCVRTLESEPGRSLLAALLTTLLTPLLFLLLLITVLGIVAVPFLAIGVLCATIFGKVVILAFVGRRCTPMLAGNPVVHTVVGVLVGGLIVLVLYTIPIVGFLIQKLIELLGLGVVAYTLLLASRARRPPRTPAAGEPAGGSGGGIGEGAQGEGAQGAGGPDVGGPGVGGPGVGGPGVSIGVSLPRAGFAIRMAALLIDVILIGIILRQVHEGTNLDLLMLATYGAVMWKLKGSTVGGIICGLHVVRLDGRPIDWPTAIVRALGCFLSLVVVGLGFLWIAIDSERQSWHDKIAGTVVVRAPKGASLLDAR
jgi:uncharacterized RDD family membrane protein YckC